jgi:geranylgeranyl pyrophosphate synthase
MVFEPSQLTMSLPSRRQRTVAHLFDLLGVFFQVRDDYINLMSATYWEKKGFCDDLFERKFSLPVIHMVRGRFGKYLELLRLYQQEQPLTRQDVEAMLSWIRETPALSFTRDVLQSLRMQIEEAITSAGFESLRERVLDSLPIDVP